MNKKYLLIMKSIIVVTLISSIILLSSCSTPKSSVQDSKLSDLQVTACNSADKGGTCNTKLEGLGVVTKNQCCNILGKCC
jgi:hypothetical protein